MTDIHIRRSGDDYAEAFAQLLPRGVAWPREPDTALMAFVLGLSEIWGAPVDSRAADLLERETDPRFTVEMLADWERNWGLPDPCFFGTQQSIEQRRAILLLKMTLLGSQSRQFFIDIAKLLGYDITITEYAPFMAGVSQAGDTRPMPIDADNPLHGDFRWYIGEPEMRYVWTVHVSGASLTWFRSASGQAGVDPHLLIGRASDLECLLNRWKPAHTVLLFDYSGMLEPEDPMAGTP